MCAAVEVYTSQGQNPVEIMESSCCTQTKDISKCRTLMFYLALMDSLLYFLYLCAPLIVRQNYESAIESVAGHMISCMCIYMCAAVEVYTSLGHSPACRDKGNIVTDV